MQQQGRRGSCGWGRGEVGHQGDGWGRRRPWNLGNLVGREEMEEGQPWWDKPGRLVEEEIPVEEQRQGRSRCWAPWIWRRGVAGALLCRGKERSRR